MVVMLFDRYYCVTLCESSWGESMRCRECGREFPEWSWENPVCPSCLARAKTGQPRTNDPNEEDFWKRHPDLKLRPVELDHQPVERKTAEFSVGSDHEEAATAAEPVIHEPSHLHQFERTEHAQHHPTGVKAESAAPPVPEKYRIEQVGQATEFVADAKPSEEPALGVTFRPATIVEPRVEDARPAEQAEAPHKLFESSPSGKFALRMERGAYLRVEPIDAQFSLFPGKPFVGLVGFIMLMMFSIGVAAPGAFFLVPASIAVLIYVYISLPHFEIIELTPLGMSRTRLFGRQMKSARAFQGRPTGAVVGAYGTRGTNKLNRLTALLREPEVVIVSGKQWSEAVEPGLTAEDRSWLAGRIREFCLSLRKD